MTSMPPRVISRPRKPIVGTVNLLTNANLEWDSQLSDSVKTGKGTNGTTKKNSGNVAPRDDSPKENMVSKKPSKQSTIGRQSGNFHANYREIKKIKTEKLPNTRTNTRKVNPDIQRSRSPLSSSNSGRYGKSTFPKENEKKLSSLEARDYLTSNSDVSKSRLMHTDRQKRTKVVKEILPKGRGIELNSTRLTKNKATNGKIYKPGSARNGTNTEVRPVTKDGTTQKSNITKTGSNTVTKSLSTNNKQNPEKIPPKKNEAKTVKITTGARFSTSQTKKHVSPTPRDGGIRLSSTRIEQSIKDVPGKVKRTRVASHETEQDVTDVKCDGKSDPLIVLESEHNCEGQPRKVDSNDVSARNNEQYVSNVPAIDKTTSSIFQRSSEETSTRSGALSRLNIRDIISKYSAIRETSLTDQEIVIKRGKVCIDIFCNIFTGRNEVVAKVIFLHLSVILFTWGMSASVHAGIPHTHTWEQTPPQSGHPREQPPPRAATPPEQTPPGADLPLEQTPPPPNRHPPGADTPPGSRLRHTVNERPVRILLECILVYYKSLQLGIDVWKM